MSFKKLISKKIRLIQSDNTIKEAELLNGQKLFNNGDCQILSQSAIKFDFLVSDNGKNANVSLKIEDAGEIKPFRENKMQEDWDKYAVSALFKLNEELSLLESGEEILHKKYSREGMKKRVLEERKDKALKAKYRIKWADNIYGDHILTNENGLKYKIFLRDFKNETGYSDSWDSRVNKLGTTKHIMFAFDQLKSDRKLFNKLSKDFPFIEIFLDPLNDNRISWYYPGRVNDETVSFLSKYFGTNNFIEDKDVLQFAPFVSEAESIDDIFIRPEVIERIGHLYENDSLSKINRQITLDFSKIKAELFQYQKEGVEFSTFRKAAIIADEMGLGKTIQAISTAIFKKEIFGFTKTLIVCPASLKDQWKKEIEKFTDQTALIVEGLPDEREKQYKQAKEYFLIVNYETVLRDKQAINNTNIDFLILDEAQKIKNFATKTAASIKDIDKKHALVITGTPIENKLIDLFSIVSVLDPHFFGPLWEFSWKHCLFDPEKINKINGYYNLQQLNEKVRPILLRREKQKVLSQLPNVRHIDIPVNMHPEQENYHASYAKGVAQIIRKKFLTPFDLQKLQLLLTSMRMVCDSTFLIDKETNHSPKLQELEYILLEKLDLKNNNRKVIIFSEWILMHKLFGEMLRKNNIGFVELNGKVPVKTRGELIRKFEKDDDCRIFLSTEAGGAGLNLQAADTVINFELPWNPAKKNQRIGRIDRLGQKNKHLTVINLITKNSIETRIASGLLVKQNLFDSVLNSGAKTDFVDFSEKGRSQFLKDLENMIAEQEKIPASFDYDEGAQTEEVEGNESQTELFSENDADEDKITPLSSADLEDPIKQEEVKMQQESNAVKFAQMEEVMNKGMGFLSGLYKMSTGKDLGTENQKIEIDHKTGEVTMKFKLPGFSQ